MAKKKPDAVTRYMEEFSKPCYLVDVLKVEVPFNIKYVEGSRAHAGESAYTQAHAMRLFRSAASAATKPFIYLSAGVSNEALLETLELASQAGTKFCRCAGVAVPTWQEDIPVYGQTGGRRSGALVGNHRRRKHRGAESCAGVGRQTLVDGLLAGKENIELVDQVVRSSMTDCKL